MWGISGVCKLALTDAKTSCFSCLCCFPVFPNETKTQIYLTISQQSDGAGTFRNQPFGRQKFPALFGDNNVAQMSRQICSHTSSALNAGPKRRAIWSCLNVATWQRERSDRAIQQNMLTSSNISVNSPI